MLPHRDSKDVFILGGIDDIQALLDDSMVNIQFICKTCCWQLFIDIAEGCWSQGFKEGR